MQAVKIKILFQVFFVLSLLPDVQAQSFSFLNVPGQPRVTALGGNHVSLRNTDPNLFQQNPAASTDTLQGWASASYLFYFADVGMANFAYRHNHKSWGNFGFAVQHLDLGSIESYDETGAYNGTFNAAETALVVNHSRQSGNFVFGINAKLAFSNLAGDRAVALLFDAGGMFVHPQKDLTAALVFKNLGFVLSDFDAVNATEIPWDIQAGITFKPENMPARFSFTVYDVAAWSAQRFQDAIEPSAFNAVMSRMVVGTEILFRKNVSALVGYNYLRRRQLGLDERAGVTGFSFGLAARFSMIDLSYSHAIYHAAGASNQISVAYNMGSLFNRGNLL
ncbi:MAG TPA: type IX secretion system protein PorQ [Cyclobacteriaceae bacterium]|nr:type IX secretion system protein PorQ [Cyclobacteriaceae bacterium]